jgi:AcrR family transcriptional regulator
MEIPPTRPPDDHVSDHTERRPRGRPRSETARQAIVTAAGELVLAGGGDAVTMEGIAARAGVSKATVYKWWPSRQAVMLEGLLAVTRDTMELPADGDLATMLRLHVGRLVALLRDGPAGPLLAALAGQGQSDAATARALLDQWIRPRRAVTEAALSAAVTRGELRADTDVAVALDQLYAPVYYRLIFGHEALDDDLADRVVTQLLRGLRSERA